MLTIAHTKNIKLNYTGALFGGIIGLTASLGFNLSVVADTVKARCDVYPNNSKDLISSEHCNYSQRQGAVSIQLKNGTLYELSPDPNKPDRYFDQNGKSAARVPGLGNKGQIFKVSGLQIYVFWDPTLKNSAQKSAVTPENLYSKVPPKLQDLVGARAGQAEDDLISRGYTYKNTVTFDGGKSAYYIEKSTGYCVEVGTTEGRFSSIVYNSSDRCKN